ncbi:MAG: hypothetical protein M1817_006359 [Caeruleum heppii]|nr:MAG: hypothetical protein M1817_006359 [Caeruleum heppii]
MTPRRSKPNHHPTHPHPHPPNHPSETDHLTPTPHIAPRTNEALNLSVLRRHNPSTTAILSIAPYAVLYLFSPTSQTWEKTGTEGTLFVSQLAPVLDGSHPGAERYAVTILNRRGLENFCEEVKSEGDVEVAGEYVILRVEEETPDGGRKMLVYGLWIFSEPEPSSTAHTRELNARIIRDCAAQAESSRREVEQKKKLRLQGQPPQQREGPSAGRETDRTLSNGRSITLNDLFGGAQGRMNVGQNNEHNHQQPPQFQSHGLPHWQQSQHQNAPPPPQPSQHQPPIISPQPQHPLHHHQQQPSHPNPSAQNLINLFRQTPPNHPSQPPSVPPPQSATTSLQPPRHQPALQHPFAPSPDTQFFRNPGRNAQISSATATTAVNGDNGGGGDTMSNMRGVGGNGSGSGKEDLLALFRR